MIYLRYNSFNSSSMREKFSVGKEGSWIVRWGFGIQVFSGGGR